MDLIVPSTWTIVKFTEDNSVAAVPTKWIIRDDECLWPPFPPHKLHTTVKNQTDADPHWPSYKVHIFRNATYGTYIILCACFFFCTNFFFLIFLFLFVSFCFFFEFFFFLFFFVVCILLWDVGFQFK